MLRRPGRAPAGSDSKVRRPMMMGLPIVTSRKRFMSPLIWKGMEPAAPIAPWSAVATITDMEGRKAMSVIRLLWL